jgi:glycoprotein endo-alpha-1,2-mannosidase
MYCSSRDPTIMLQHFADLQRAKVRTIVVSWWGQVHKQESTDNQELSTDLTVALLLTLADVTLRAVSVCFHLEPHPGRSASSTLEDMQYIYKKYGHHSFLTRRKGDGRVVFCIYDSYHISPADWAEIFTPTGDCTKAVHTRPEM